MGFMIWYRYAKLIIPLNDEGPYGVFLALSFALLVLQIMYRLSMQLISDAQDKITIALPVHKHNNDLSFESTQLRIPPYQWTGVENLYCRGDGTLSYFFSVEDLSARARAVGFELEESRYVCVINKNRKTGVEVST
jgi:hypothetical protein